MGPGNHLFWSLFRLALTQSDIQSLKGQDHRVLGEQSGVSTQHTLAWEPSRLPSSPCWNPVHSSRLNSKGTSSGKPFPSELSQNGTETPF